MNRTLRTSLALVLVAAFLAPIAAMAAQAAGTVNVNTASVEELALLPRVGPSVAGRIVEHREANGKFAALEDLMLVRGIGEKTFELIKPYASLSGETTLKEKVRVPKAADAPAEEER
jgi:competence protein ComEA